jgi:L-lactate dehydrogenase (cytochrome)
MNHASAGLRKCFNVSDVGEMARRRLPRPIWNYLEGGADDEVSKGRNARSFEQYDLLPKILEDVSVMDLSTTVLGETVKWPVVLGPTGMPGLLHRGGERAVARAAARHGVLYAVSTLASTTIEDIAAAAPGPKCFQLYVLRNKSITAELVDRAKAAGYTSLCLTVDSVVGGNRERDWRSGMTMPPRLTLPNLVDVLLHPRWLAQYLLAPKLQFANVEKHFTSGDRSNMVRFLGSQFATNLGWGDLEWLAGRWNGPIAVKGMMGGEAARRAVDAGATALVISNHGGRQLDRTPASLEMLPEVVEAVGQQAEVLIDGGIRRATDILTAIALGAKACMIGRPFLYGLAAGGEAGVDHVLTLLTSELTRCMTLMGCPKLRDLDHRRVRRR